MRASSFPATRTWVEVVIAESSRDPGITVVYGDDLFMSSEDEGVDQPGSNNYNVYDTSEEGKSGDVENGLREPLLGPDERVEDVGTERGDDT